MDIYNIKPENSPLKDHITVSTSLVEWWLEDADNESKVFLRTLPNCTRCGRFVGASNYGMWRDEGVFEMSEWYIYCKECV